MKLAAVEYINSKPLIHGLAEEAGLDLALDVPSALLGRLEDRSADVALLPVIDYQRLAGLRVVPAGGIGCDGPTLTVRLFGRRAIGATRVLACDGDSHTSVALARVVLAEAYGLAPEFVPLAHAASADTLLLIGDKVICEAPPDGEFPHQLDLGGAWKELTGLPFLFAVWTARAGVELGDLPARLERAKREGLAEVDRIVETLAVPRGWPASVARRYLTEYLKFDVGERQLEAVRRFHQLAAKHGMIGPDVRPLVVV